MHYLIVGYKIINYTNQTTGKKVDGCELHLVSCDEDSTITKGQSVLKFYVSSRIFTMSDTYLNRECNIVYNLVGGQPRLCNIEIL